MSDTKLVEFTEVSPVIPVKRRPPRAGMGRPKGAVNKATAEVKLALQLAYAEAGGDKALANWAKDNPTEFYKIWAKLLPVELQNKHEGGITISVMTGVGRDPENG